MSLGKIIYKIKTKIGLKVSLIDHLIYLKPKELSPLGKKLQSIFDDHIFDAFTKTEEAR